MPGASIAAAGYNALVMRPLPLVALLGSLLAAGCVAPPREKPPVEPIPPRPLTPMSLPPLDGVDSDFAGPEPLPPAPVGAQTGGRYTVVRGDTLSGIARRYYGNPSAWKNIAAANPGVNPNDLKVGQTLVLP